MSRDGTVVSPFACISNAGHIGRTKNHLWIEFIVGSVRYNVF